MLAVLRFSYLRVSSNPQSSHRPPSISALQLGHLMICGQSSAGGGVRFLLRPFTLIGRLTIRFVYASSNLMRVSEFLLNSATSLSTSSVDM
jgi:hypothetical protein